MVFVDGLLHVALQVLYLLAITPRFHYGGGFAGFRVSNWRIGEVGRGNAHGGVSVNEGFITKRLLLARDSFLLQTHARSLVELC